MKIKNIFILIALLLTGFVFGDQKSDLTKANSLYKSGQYTEAAETYENIVKQYGSAPELYYNLGNAYFKSDEIGKSILNYERALRLESSFADARHNLEFAQTKIVDNIVQVPPFFLKKWLTSLIRLLSPDQWYVISLFLLIFTLSGFLHFIFGRSLAFRKISFYLSFIFLALTIVSVTFATIRLNKLVQHNEAIIMTGTVTVKSSPDKSGTDLFQLHEGTKVEIKGTLESWIEIEVGNGNVGWIERAKVEKI